MKLLTRIVLLLSIAIVQTVAAVAQESSRPTRPPREASAPVGPDTTMLSGAGLNTTGGPIDRLAEGGVHRKDRGTRTWYFVPSISAEASKAAYERQVQDYLRLHGNEVRDVVLMVDDTTDVAKLRSLDIRVTSALPCTLNVRLRNRQLPQFKDAGIRFWIVPPKGAVRPDRPPGPPPERPQLRQPNPHKDASRRESRVSSREGGQSILACPQTMPFSDGFEVCGVPSDSWTVYGSGVVWGDLNRNCAYTRNNSNWSLSAAGSGGPCYGYSNGQYTWVQNPNYFDMRTYTEYTISYWIYHDLLNVSADFFELQFSNAGDVFTAYHHFTASSSGWVQRTLVVPNSTHSNDYAKFRFLFGSGYQDSHLYYGVYIDDITITGIQAPNLTYHTPPGWSGPIVPSATTGGYTTGTLHSGCDTYIDWAIVNTGGATNSTIYIDYYIDNVYIGGDTKFGLAAGAPHTRPDWLYDPFPGLSPGNHTLKLVIDAGSGESSTADNTYQQTFYWNPSNLTVLSVVPTTTTPTVGQTISATVTVRR